MLEKQKADEEKKRLFAGTERQENVTRDGTKVNIYANISVWTISVQSSLNDAGGIGLFRSEFLYLENNDYPNEEQQFFGVQACAGEHGGKKVIIRTLDIGANQAGGLFPPEKRTIRQWATVQFAFA